MTDRQPSEDSDIDFPEMRQAALDRPTLEQYLADLKACTDILEVTVKGRRREHTDDESCSLDEAMDLLLAGQVRGIQIRYVWQNEGWWDTLMRRDGGIHLTRIRPPTEI